MKTKQWIKAAMLMSAVLLLLTVSPISAGAIELADLLTQNLGVSGDQAMGGAGAIFKLAQGSLSTGNFSKIAAAVPGMDQMLGAAPSTAKSGGTLGGLTSSFGGGSLEKLGGISSLAGSFLKLGLESDMVGKFVPVILSYVESKGGQTARQILETVLK